MSDTLDLRERLQEALSQRTEAEGASRLSKARLAAIFASAMDAIISVDNEHRVVMFNPAAEAMFGYRAQAVVGRPLSVLIPQRFRERHGDHIALFAATGTTHRKMGSVNQLRALHAQGHEFPIEASISQSGAGDQRIFTVIVRDITDRVRADNERQLFVNVFNHTVEAILISDADNRIMAVNQAFTKMTGYPLDEVRGQNPRMLSSGQTPVETYREMWAALVREGFWHGELWDRRKDGTVFPKWLTVAVVRNAGGAISNYVGTFIDITEQKRSAERIAHLAHQDSLTNLFNRVSLKERLGQAIALVSREHTALAVLLIDLDHFKNVNDSLGHGVGDELLVEVALRLGDTVRDCDIVARLGGDEFVAVLADIDVPTATHMAEVILGVLSEPYRIRGHELHTTPSIGLAVYPEDGRDSETLLRNADSAMYSAKSMGRGNVQFYNEAMNRSALERLRLDHDLRTAIANEEFELNFQPKIDAAPTSPAGRVVGVEALIRWRHPKLGLISPNTFIPVAEETGLIVQIGEWVINEACRQLSAWRKHGIADITMAVNLCARQLRSPSLPVFVGECLHMHGLAGTDLELEITESVVMENPSASIAGLNALRTMGVTLSIDDFGTGYSSLSYLKLLPLHSLKIDQSFVRDIETDANDVAICTATIALAHNLGLTVVAEGVETEAQRILLTSHRCDFLQGYLFSRPLPADDAREFIRKRNLVSTMGVVAVPG